MTKRQYDNRDGAPPQDDPMRCNYLGHTSPHPRAVKSTGEHHRMCDTHREKANAAERKSKHSKKQKQLDQSEWPTAPPCQRGRERESTALVREDMGSVIQTVLVEEHHVRCTYNNKCTVERAMKRNGSRHRFCASHRVKANMYQYKYTRKQRGRSIDAMHQSVIDAPEGLTNQVVHLINDPQAVLAEHGLDLSPLVWDTTVDGSSSGDLGALFFDDVESGKAFKVLADDVPVDEATPLLVNLEPWFLDYVAELYKSLSGELP